MRVPLSWVREFAAIPESISPEEISDALVRVGFEVEAIERQGQNLSGPVVVGQVLTIEELTGHKKPIRWVELNCGDLETRFVICGATNFKVGDFIVAALPGAVLPDNFVISQRETYGKVSNGMICSSRELGTGQDHDGILVLPQDAAEPGTDAISLLEINDVVFEVAVNPDRGYALSIRGIGREAAASLGVKFTDPINQVEAKNYSEGEDAVDVFIDDPTAASVIFLRSLAEFQATRPTPLWMKRRIEKCGMRSISLAVDVTNYVMLELGQPLHAFDSSAIKGSIHIQRAGANTSLTTFDGQARTLNSDDLVVADDEGPLALAGTMGGKSSEISEGTHSIAIEAARFDPTSVSRNARRHKLFSEASKRFERGVDSSLAEIASARAVQLLVDLGGAKHIGTRSAGQPRYAPVVSIDPHYVATLTGADISLAMVEEKLLIVGCDVEKIDPRNWNIDPPSWRHDLLQAADFVEEVARMVGYQAIPSLLPPHPVSPGLTSQQQRRRKVALLLADKGLAEVQTYPFVSAAVLKAMGYAGERAATFRIANPMSEDAPLLRPHLIPGLIGAALKNLSRGSRNFGIFEIGSIFKDVEKLVSAQSPATASRPAEAEISAIYASVPNQPIHVGGLLIGQVEIEDWHSKGRAYDWSDSVAFVEEILEMSHLKWDIKPANFAPWHPGRCAEFLVSGKVVAHAGELHPRVCEAMGIPARTCAFVVNMSSLPESSVVKGTLLGTMPVAVQDIALIVDKNIPAQAVEAALREGAGELLESIQLFDRYDQLGDGKVSLAFSLTFRAPDRTLTNAEVSVMRENAAEKAFKQTGAEVRA
ncbi:MAG: phenylalanine--tRNA ligase subunit beta [Actinobacteria bacterium]|nr:phenylalanine--tRNA ligase subunit beta [Actinomycetota bacterium]